MEVIGWSRRVDIGKTGREVGISAVNTGDLCLHIVATVDVVAVAVDESVAVVEAIAVAGRGGWVKVKES